MSKEKNLSICHVYKSFPMDNGSLEVLRDIDLEIEGGEFVSVVGSSGCGKSTLLRIIAGLEKASSGHVKIGEREIEKPSVATGMIFQNSRLFPWMSVKSNIKFGIHSRVSEREADELAVHYIEVVGLKGFENALPGQLSGGMQQRVSIARALINHPDVLLLDEPFGALDALKRIQMQNEVLDIWKKERTTMILITHDIDEAIFLSDRILIMENNPGQIKREIPVPMERPRERNAYQFIDIRKEIYKEFFKSTELDVEYYI